MTGYWPAPWPAEDGGPRRLQTVPDGRLDVGNGGLYATSRAVLGGTMVIQRDTGELYLQGAVIGPDSTAWVERIDPRTLESIARLEALPGGTVVARRRAGPRQRRSLPHPRPVVPPPHARPHRSLLTRASP